MVFRKRVFASAFNRSGPSNGTRAFKRRRFNRKRRFAKRTGGRKTTDYTSLNTRGHAVGFRGRKTSRATFQRHIWNSTTFKPHYRSVRTQDIVNATPGSTTDGTIHFLNMYQFSGVGFGTALGGTREIDIGVGVPTFEESTFILRGGKFEMTIVNTSTTADIKVKLWRITTGNNPDFGIIGSEENYAWDPSVTADFYNKIGKPFMSREVTIEQGNSYTFVTRFKTQKIDGEAYNTNARSPYLFMLVSAVQSTVVPYIIRQSYNLSFTADAI